MSNEVDRVRAGQHQRLIQIGILSVACAALLSACAPRSRSAPAAVTAPKYGDFVFPSVPQSLQRTRGAERIDRGWRYLQSDDLRNAEREFAQALTQNPALYPARTGEAYVALARRNFDRALTGFDAALGAAAGYAPALVGRGQALLGLQREPEALTAFEAALAADPSLTDLGARIEVLRFRDMQALIGRARTAAAAGRLDEARLAYERVLQASADSGFLHRELGLLERKAGRLEAALTRLRRATELDPGDAASFVDIGEILEERRDFVGAGEAYRKAASVGASDDIGPRIAAVAEKARLAALPAEYQSIASNTSSMTRGELAALIGVELERVLKTASPRQVVITDVRGHWAEPWITQVVQAGIMDAFENHTFQPRSRVRRADLAAAVSRLVTVIAASRPALRNRLSERPRIADMDPGHLSYPAVSVAVASGVMPLLEGQRFDVARAASGAEAVAVIGRLRALAADPR